MSKWRSFLGGIVFGLPLLALLVVFWMLLWGGFSWLNLAGGIVVAVLVTSVFYLPAVLLTDRVDPWRLAVYFGRLLVDIAHASLQVAWLALSPRYRPSNAIVAVHLRTRSDLITTWVGVSTSIVPGSIVVDIDRVESILYLHVLDVRSPAEAARFSESVLATERRVVAAIGTREDVERVRELLAGERPQREARPGRKGRGS